MGTVQVTGTIPAVIAEGSRPGDWAAMLALAYTGPGRILSVETIGSGASFLAARFDPALMGVFLEPDAVLDYEAFAAAGLPPEIAVSLRIRFEDGTVVDDPTVFRATVLDRDDTPPQALAFAPGEGQVVAGAFGVPIGRLVVTDLDSAGPFFFRFTADDAWRFQVSSDGTLMLRSGVNLNLNDIPIRPVLVEVSDGTNSAGFVLDIQVIHPDSAPPTPGLVLAAGEMRGAVALAAEGVALVAAPAASFESLGPAAGSGGRSPPQRLLLEAGEAALLPAGTARIVFTDGVLERDAAGPVAQAAALHRALSGAPSGADGATIGGMLARLERGEAPVALAAPAVAEAAPDEAFLAGLYGDALGRAATAEEMALHLGRLGSGVARAQVAVDVALGAESLGRQAESAPEGIWAALPLGQEAPDPWAPADPGAAAPPATPAPLLDFLLV